MGGGEGVLVSFMAHTQAIRAARARRGERVCGIRCFLFFFLFFLSGDVQVAFVKFGLRRSTWVETIVTHI